MLPKINKNLIVLKVYLFGFYGAVGSLWPFLTLHMNQLGLNVEEIAVINLILPFSAAFCKPMVGIIADKTGRVKLMLFIMFITTSCFFTSLLLVPPVDKGLSPVEDVEFPSSFTCNPTSARVSSDTCWNDTSILNFTRSIIKLQNCTFPCTTQIPKPLPKLCFNTTNSLEKRCISLKPHDKIVLDTINFDVTTSKCEYQIGQNQIRGILATDLQCPSPGDGCEVKCESALATHTPSPERSTKAKGSSLTFWLYLALRCCAEMILSSCYPLSDVINLNLTGRFGGYFGQQQLLGILALGIFGPISGFLVDYIGQTTGVTSYAPCFFISNALILVSLIALYIMPAIETKDFKSTSSGSLHVAMRGLLSNTSLLVLFVVCAALGVMWGYMETFLYLYLLQKNGPRLLIGLTQFVSVLPSLPILYKSGLVMRKIGHVNLVIVAFFTYTIRCIGYVFMVNPWWALLLESTRVLSLYLPRLCFTMYANELTPPELKVTTQSIVFLLHFDVGRGLGSLFGGKLKDALGDKTTFQIIAVYSGLLGCAYFALHHFYLKNRHLQNRKTPSLSLSVHQKEQKSKPTQNGHVNHPLLQSEK